VQSNLAKGRITKLSPLRLQKDLPDLDSHLVHSSLGPLEPALQTASRSVTPFWLSYISVINTETTLLRVTSVTIGYACDVLFCSVL